jgi:hypothetical protein
VLTLFRSSSFQKSMTATARNSSVFIPISRDRYTCRERTDLQDVIDRLLASWQDVLVDGSMFTEDGEYAGEDELKVFSPVL